MSDTDADAGDERSSDFDKEAEREKLREKFARDDEKRESTQRMSELLLQGATMTNKHCDTCGDPLFRQNGQEFCATCGAERPDEESSADGVAKNEATTPDEADGNAAAPASRPAEGDERRATPSRAAPDDGNHAPTTAADARTEATGRSVTPSSSSPPSPSSTDAAGDVEGARDALVAALTRHASAGAKTDDPRAARDHLAAAREAAEALSALRR